MLKSNSAKSDSVFIIPFHVKSGKGSIMPLDASGAYVSCYTIADGYELAVKKCLFALAADGLHVEEILQPINAMQIADWAVHIAEQWPRQMALLPDQCSFEMSVRAGKVVYGPFGTYYNSLEDV